MTPAIRIAFIASIALAAAAVATEARADGGVLRISQRCGSLQVSVFTSPSLLRAGPVDVSVLVQDATSGRVKLDIPPIVRLEKVDSPRVTLELPATAEAATNKLFQAALFDVPFDGVWRVSVILAAPDERQSTPNRQTLQFDLTIAPPLPPWLAIAPWVGWPFVAIGLFLGHQRLRNASKRSRQKIDCLAG